MDEYRRPSEAHKIAFLSGNTPSRHAATQMLSAAISAVKCDEGETVQSAESTLLRCFEDCIEICCKFFPDFRQKLVMRLNHKRHWQGAKKQ